MGQLEKYGLYVLVLLAFLIIGVAIWGKPAEARPDAPHTLNVPANSPKTPPANGGNSAKPDGNQGTNGKGADGGGQGPGAPQARDLSKALQQAPTVEIKKDDVKKDDGNKNNAGGGNDSNKTAGGGEARPPSAEDSKRPEYKVKTGETFERIAREQLGHPGMSGEIAKLNSKIEPTKLRATQVIVLPSKAEVAAWKAARAPKKAEAEQKVADPKVVDPKVVDPKTGKPQPAVAADKSTYTVARGDTFEGIARRVLGDPKRASDIQELNPSVTARSMKIGTVLKMPLK